MQISCKFVEFCSCCLLLKFRLFNKCLASKFIELLSNFFILSLDVLQVAFSGIEIMLVFPAIEATIIFLYYFSLFIEEFALFIFHFILLLIHKLATANITSPDALDFQCSFLFILKLPFHSEHSPILLDYKGCCIFFISKFFSFIYHYVVRVNKVSMTLLTFFEVYCH